MSSPHDSAGPPRRRPFASSEPPQSFFGSSEFQRILWFGGLLAFVGLFALYVTSRAKHRTEDVAVQAPPPVELSPEALEERRTKLSTLFEGALVDTKNGDDFLETEG